MIRYLTAISCFFFVFAFHSENLWSQKKDWKLIVRVVDKSTGRAIPYSFISLNGKEIGQSDSLGIFRFFSKRLGKRVIVGAEHIGYFSRSDTLNLNGTSPTQIILFLSPNPIHLRKITIQDYQPFWGMAEGKMVLSPAIMEMSHLWSGDLMRILQDIPGSSFRTDANSKIYLGGGDFYQTTILWNGIPVFNTSHIGGFIGAIPATTSDSILVSSGSSTLEWGPGTLVGSVEVWSGFPKGWVLDANPISGLIDMGYAHHTSRLDWRARMIHYDLAARLSKTTIPYTFGDLGVKFQRNVGSFSALELKSYSSMDRINLDIHDVNQSSLWTARWGNFLWGISFETKPSDKVKMKLFARKSLSFTRGGKSPDHVAMNFSYIDAGIKIGFSTKNFLLKTKIAYNALQANYNWKLHAYSLWDMVYYPGDIFYDFAPLQERYAGAFQYIPIAQDAQFQGKVWRIAFDSRFDFPLHGQYAPFWSGGANWQWDSPFGTLGIKAGQRHQYYFAVKQNTSMGFDDPFAAHFIIDATKRAVPLSRYVTFMNEKTFGNWQMGLRGYVKQFDHIPLSDSRFKRIVQGKGFSYGSQVWGEYWSKHFATSAWIDIGEAFLHQQEWYRASYSRPFQFRSLSKWKLGRKWFLHFSLYYLAGIPYTNYDHKYLGFTDLSKEDISDGRQIDFLFHGKWWDMGTENRFVASRLFGGRTPNYFRMDLGLQFRFYQSAMRQANFYLRVFNLTNRRNVVGYLWKQGSGTDAKSRIRGLPIVPMFGIQLSPK